MNRRRPWKLRPTTNHASHAPSSTTAAAPPASTAARLRTNAFSSAVERLTTITTGTPARTSSSAYSRRGEPAGPPASTAVRVPVPVARTRWATAAIRSSAITWLVVCASSPSRV
ncbi:MAG TPA: hypothetical protein VIC57_16625 [Candidatus Dormibacteraeota bacterium]